MNLYDSSLLMFLMLVLYTSGILVSLIFYKKHKICNIFSNLLSSLAAVIGIWLSLQFILKGAGRAVISSFTSNVPYISFNIVLDSLSAFFILALSILVLCVSIYSIGYVSHYYNKRNVGIFNILYNIFIISMITVFTSGNIIFFIISWEIMALVSYFLVIFESEQQENRKAGIIYLIMTHIGTAFLIIAFMLIYKYTHSFDIGVNMAAVPSLIKNIIFILFLIGFGTKAGIIPLHVWLPYAHPAAPSNVSALMSGIMIKTAVYGILRFVFAFGGTLPAWWGAVILGIGAVSAVLGIAYAFMENNIKRLLAYSSIENMGIIFIGIGVSFIAYSSGNKVLSGLSLMAALFHLLNHTIFKGALFLGAGSVHFATHTKDIEELGGLIKKMPYTGFFILIASLSISAIPPFNGFVSEWLTYQSLFMGLSSGTAGVSLLEMICVAALAMAGAMAAACFIKLIGIAFLGLPRSQRAISAREVPYAMNLAIGILASLCFILGIFPQMVIKLIDRVNFDMFGITLIDQMQRGSFFTYYPITFDKNSISPLVLLVFGILVVIFVLILVRVLGRNTKERKFNTWDCGFQALSSRMQYSATGFSKPLRIVFRALYRPARELQVEQGLSPYFPKSMKYSVSTQSLFEKYFYYPITRIITRAARRIRISVQTGSIHAYLIYIFAAVIVLLVYYRLN